MPPPREVTQLPAHIKGGDTRAAEQLIPLAHEAYLRLAGAGLWRAEPMRCILLDRARRKDAEKRRRVDSGAPKDEIAAPAGHTAGLLAIDEALARYFIGMSIEETAAVLEISPVTVKREWNMAKALLRHAVGQAAEPE